MIIEWDNGLVKRITDGGLRGGDWGAETADRSSFFTLTGRPYGCRIRAEECAKIPDGFVRRVEVEMAEGCWALEVEVTRQGATISVRQTLDCLEDSVFQDFVVRFRFDGDSFEQARIAGRTLAHENRNLWHQYPVQDVWLTGRHGAARIRACSSVTAGKFQQMAYVRDEPGSWIVHMRLIPSGPPDLYWIRWANRWFTLSVGDRWSRRLLAHRWIKDPLWYLSERRGGRPALQAQGLAVLGRGERIALSAECEIRTEPTQVLDDAARFSQTA